MARSRQSDLRTCHGRIVDLRRHVNVHWRHMHPIVPTDRWKQWLRAPDLEAWQTAKRLVPLH